VNLTPLRDWYRANAEHVQMDSTRWANALSPHTLDELALAVELIDLPEGNLPTPAYVNGLLAEVRLAARQVEQRAAADVGFQRFREARAAIRKATA